ncbi:Predicted arabinose efflux permease, MFS family [Ruegeria halocynthiae]|uniref:Predicted arabinose efflux permease, MFS family n=1 Tax=Ruegeria halocynthiae TaxID=985054 RepID=A0A1H2SUE6_9RHOB|nr:MFS transporter [Ruegeria halocynthiae]SDW35303.1 Predicted arabinose efflux permease, MFS family [Ruegeria halocynthiae]
MSDSFRIFLQVILIWFAGLGAATQFAKIAVPFADIGLLYPDHAAVIGWLLSIISLMGAALGAISGAFTARIGPKRLLLSGLFLGGALSFLQANLPGFQLMLLSRVIEGLSHLAIVVAAPTLIAQITTGRARYNAMVLWSTFFGVAFALNAWLGLPIVNHYGLPAYFALHGGLMLVIAILVALSKLKIDIDQPDDMGWGLTAFLGVHLRTYRSPFISAPAIGWFFYTLTFVSLLAILPGRLPEGQGASIAALMPLAGIVLSWLLVPFLLTVLSCISVVNLGFALGIITIIALFLGAPLAFGCIALFAVLGLVQGGSFAAVPELNDTAETQALSYGAMAQMGNAGNLLGAPVLLAILMGANEASMFVAVAAFYGIAILVHLALAKRRKSTGLPGSNDLK